MDSSFRCCFAAILKSFHSSLFSHIFFFIYYSFIQRKDKSEFCCWGASNFPFQLNSAPCWLLYSAFFVVFRLKSVVQSFTCYDRFSVYFLTAWKMAPRINFSHFRFVSESEKIYINNCMYLCFFSFFFPLLCTEYRSVECWYPYLLARMISSLSPIELELVR